jgi:hypothetical protein
LVAVSTHVLVDPANNAVRDAYLSCGPRTNAYGPRFNVDDDGLWMAQLNGTPVELRLLEPFGGAAPTPRRWRVPEGHPVGDERVSWEAVAP